MKKTIFTPLLILIVTLIGVNLLLYLRTNPPQIKSEGMDCLRLRDGTAIVEVTYPQKLLYETNGHSIGLSRRHNLDFSEEGKDEFVLMIDTNYYQTIEGIIETSLVEPGPKYQKSFLNGYEAAFDRIVYSDGDTWNYYRIPLGNRVIEISYHPLFSSVNEQIQLENMLKSITLTQGKQDFQKEQVKDCEDYSILPTFR